MGENTEKKEEENAEKKEEENAEKKDGENTEKKEGEEGNKEEEKKDEEKEEDQYEEIEEQRTRKHSFPLQITQTYVTYQSLNQNQKLFEESQNILKLFKEYEAEKIKNMESKNKLEGLIYIITELTGEDGEKSGWKKFASQGEIEDLIKDSNELDEWFFSDEAFTATHTEFDQKYNEINKKITRVNFRRNEDLNREDEVNKMEARITSSRKNIEEMKTTRPWIDVEKIDKALEDIEIEDKWLKEKLEEQKGLNLFDDPVLLNSIIKQKTDKVRSFYERLRLIKKPVEKKEEKKEQTSSNSGSKD